MNKIYEKGEVVWGKIKGYPWWPAIITNFNKNLIYTIQFFDDNTYARLSTKFLLKYEENKNKIIETNKKNKKLLKAVQVADLAIQKNQNKNFMNIENNDANDINVINNPKIKFDIEQIQIKKFNKSNHNLEPKNLEKINNSDLKNNLIYKTESMSNQNNKVNIFSIVKNNKNNITQNNNIMNSPISSSKDGEESYIPSEQNNSNIESSSNNNDIIINKNLLSLNNDDKMSLLLLNNNKKIENTVNEKEKKYKKLKKFKKSKIKEKSEKKETLEKEEEEPKEKEIKKEKYFIKIEVENLDVKTNKKKEIKTKAKIDDKAKEEKKKREEEDNFIYQIDEYFYKIFMLINNKKYEQLNYEKEQFRKILIFLSKYKRANFIEFLKMTNISKYIQYFICYLKLYDVELDDLAKKVYRNFHKQFNKEFFSNQNNEI